MEEEYEDALERDELGSEDEESDEEPFDPKTERERIYRELQAKFEEDRSRLEETVRQRERDQLRTRLRDSAGIDLTDDDNFRPVDPLKVNQFAARSVGQPVVDPQDAPIDWYQDDAATISAKMERQRKRDREELLGEFQKMLAPLQNLAQQPLLGGVEGLAKQALEGYGLGAYAEHPKFAETIREAAQQAIKSGWPAEALGNPEAMAQLTLSILPKLPKPEPARERDAGGRFAAAQRAALGSTGPSRGSGAPPPKLQLDDEDRAIMEMTGITDPEEYAEFARSKREGDPDIYNNFRDRKRAKAAAGGRR